MSCCPPGSYGFLAPDHTDEGTEMSADDIRYYQVGKGKAGLLILPDVWGWNGGRTRAIADDFAKRGLNVFVPALLAPHEGGTSDDGFAPSFNLGERMSEFPPLIQGDWNAETTVPKILTVIKAMKRAGVERIGLLCFCYGAWVGLKVAAQVPEIVCGASPHPAAHLEGMVGGDPAKLGSASKCPWAFFPAGKGDGEGADPPIYDAEGDLFKALEEKFPGKNATKRFENVAHGFAVRGHIKEGEHNYGRGDEVKAAVQECFLDCARFLSKFRIGFLKPEERPPPALRKPRWNKTSQIKPDGKGLNLMLKVLSCKEDAEASIKAWDVVAGDASGIVTLRLVDETLKNACTDGASIRVQNARVLMVKGYAHIIIDKWGVLKTADAPHEFEVSKDYNASATEYELTSK